MKSLKTHPWITFSLALPEKDIELWLKVGELSSKCAHLAGVPLKPSFAAKLHSIYMAKGALATVAIEGNTLREDQAREIVEGHLTLPPSQQYLQQEMQNIIDICNHLLVSPPSPQITPNLIRQYNAAVLKGLETEEGVEPGEYRRHDVTVGRVYRGAPPEECERLIEKLCDWLNSSDFELGENMGKEWQVPFAIFKAIVAHIYLAWIHPFGDGNGRTARMLEFHILFSSGISAPASHLLSNHYNLTRSQYYRELDRASKTQSIIPFIKYAINGFLDGIRGQIQLVREQQQSVSWENYVYEWSRQWKDSAPWKRRRDLVLELSRNPNDWIKIADISNYSPKLVLEYARTSHKTLLRDVDILAEHSLIQKKHGQVKANIEYVQAFLPAQVR